MTPPTLEADRQAPYSGATNRAFVELDSSPVHAVEWSTTQRALFRFVFAYLLLYNLPFPIGSLPFTEKPKGWYDAIWNAVVPWVGAHLLHLTKPITIFPSGSGDKTFDWVLLLTYVVLATSVALVWSIVDRDRRAYPRLARWLRIYVRYVLAFTMLSYGAYKVIKTQFPNISPSTLVEPFGEFSPMGVVWTWMGASYAYNVFSGLAEMVSGFLLFFRRTATLGALCSIAVLSNVVMINFAYDVPVKQYSLHLMLMAIFVAASDFRRLYDVFILHRAVPAVSLGDQPSTRRGRSGYWVLKSAVIGFGTLGPLRESWSADRAPGFGSHAARPPLYGIWEVDSFVRGRETVPPLLGDSTRWRRFTIDYPGSLRVRLLNDSLRGFRAQIDTAKHTIILTARADTAAHFPFTYTRNGLHNDQLFLDGLMRGDSLHIRLHRVDETKFPLVSRGFHWINELPYNR